MVLAHDGNEELFRPERAIPGIPTFERSGWERFAEALTEQCEKRLVRFGTNWVIDYYRTYCDGQRWHGALEEKYCFKGEKSWL